MELHNNTMLLLESPRVQRDEEASTTQKLVDLARIVRKLSRDSRAVAAADEVMLRTPT